jgi:hypothetical protein
MSLVYLGASLFVTILNEYVTQILNTRGRFLAQTVQSLFKDPHVRELLSHHEVFARLFKSSGAAAEALPTYVDPQVMARALVGGLMVRSTQADALTAIKEELLKLPDSSLRTQLMTLVAGAGGSVDALVKDVADWGERSLSALGDGYKRHLQGISFALGLCVAIGANIDSIRLCSHLYHDKQSREAMVALGDHIATTTTQETLKACSQATAQAASEAASEAAASASAPAAAAQPCKALNGLVQDVIWRQDHTEMPVGWPDPALASASGCSASGLLLKLLGWLITAFALSLGAPFWFDLLNKFVNVRHGMRKPDADADKA